jgi:hypothetical protein
VELDGRSRVLDEDVIVDSSKVGDVLDRGDDTERGVCVLYANDDDE